CCGALPVAYADSPRRVAAYRTHAGGARVARRQHRSRLDVRDAQVRGGRRRFRVARAARLRGDGHLWLSVAGLCGRVVRSQCERIPRLLRVRTQALELTTGSLTDMQQQPTIVPG